MIRVHSQPAEWLPVSIAPSDADLEVCVMDYEGIVHALAFPCGRCFDEKRIDIQPTYWHKWTENH
jgi:hypothetical protein